MKLGTKHPCVKGIQICSNEGPRPFPRGDNYEIAKIHWRNFKIFFSRTTGPISTEIGTKHPWVKGIQVCSNEEPINSHEVNNVFSSSLNQRYDIIICVYWFELFSQMSDVAHGSLVSYYDYLFIHCASCVIDTTSISLDRSSLSFYLYCFICVSMLTYVRFVAGRIQWNQPSLLLRHRNDGGH